MRMSVHKDDQGYHKRAQWGYQPYLDGVKVDHCFTADEDSGYLLRHKTGKNGVVVDRVRDEIASEQLFGRVEIRRVK